LDHLLLCIALSKEIQMKTSIERAKQKLSGRVLVPALLWMAGLPLGVVLLLWFFFFRGH
jgi:hypothetical protein